MSFRELSLRAAAGMARRRAHLVSTANFRRIKTNRDQLSATCWINESKESKNSASHAGQQVVKVFYELEVRKRRKQELLCAGGELDVGAARVMMDAGAVIPASPEMLGKNLAARRAEVSARVTVVSFTAPAPTADHCIALFFPADFE
ncbi:hypothetical protein GUJ93_ZPchr0009g974 [Zizania palustris]|uniref:Uncharacterized protein n=1 Tax=Zizania palustris TaxID=103762 RepID=A0A8J5RNV6_ZIZPA|nr:hypothetical protein GUJ93_ZPchr0009g974 [Zizania palustris]